MQGGLLRTKNLTAACNYAKPFQVHNKLHQADNLKRFNTNTTFAELITGFKGNYKTKPCILELFSCFDYILLYKKILQVSLFRCLEPSQVTI